MPNEDWFNTQKESFSSCFSDTKPSLAMVWEASRTRIEAPRFRRFRRYKVEGRKSWTISPEYHCACSKVSAGHHISSRIAHWNPILQPPRYTPTSTPDFTPHICDIKYQVAIASYLNLSSRAGHYSRNMANEAARPVWLITGCSAGLGWALAKYVLEKGHRLIASSRDPSKTPDLVAEVEGKGGHWIQLDNTDPNLQEVVKKAEGIFQRIDVVVNNAGYAVMGTIEDTGIDEVVAQMKSNFYGPLKVMQGVLPGMRTRKSGVIVNVSSSQGLAPGPANGIYAASKAALEAASDSLSQEVKNFGIRVVIVSPGAFRTAFGSVGAKVVPPSQSYASDDHVVAQRMAWIPKLVDIAPGDPDKAAKMMFEAAVADKQEFLRILLGADCWAKADEKITELRRTVDGQKNSAASTAL